METKIKFDINKYLGTWYELAHYPSWFQRNDNYNTTANYELDDDANIVVTNSTISNGKVFTSVGKGVKLSTASFRVDFPELEKMKIESSPNFSNKESEVGTFQSFGEALQNGMCKKVLETKDKDNDLPNYVVQKIWTDNDDNYIIAIVTNSTKDSFYLLSKLPQPNLSIYNVVMEYVVENFDRDRLVQTPHYPNE